MNLQEKPYEAIIVGSGLGGLMTSAGLLHAGKRRILILEKSTFIGGKYTEFTYKGYKITSGSWTSMGEKSHIDRFCQEVGANVEHITLRQMKKKGIGPGLLGKVRYNNGKEFIPSSAFNIFSEKETEELTKLMMGLAAKELKGIDRSKNISLKQYADNFTKSEEIIKILDSIVGTASGLVSKTIPASEFKIIMDDGFGLASGRFGFPVGGVKAIIDSLEKVIREKGGEIRTKTNVEKIIIDDNDAKGVELSDGETIYSDIVVHNAGSKRLLRLGGKSNFLNPQD